MTDTESKSMTEISPIDRIFCAVDTPKLDDALMLADLLAGEVGAIKLGKEFFTAHGLDGVKRVADCGHKIFLDLKFHDIPNTVAGGIRAALRLNCAVMTVHASGGPAMLEAARDAAATTMQRGVRRCAVPLCPRRRGVRLNAGSRETRRRSGRFLRGPESAAAKVT